MEWTWPLIIRLAMRYGSGALITYGFATESTASWLAADPDIQNLLQVVGGLLLGAASEWWMALAHRFGWVT